MTRHPPEEPRPTHVPGTGALQGPLDILATTALLSSGGERHQRDPELDTRGAGGTAEEVEAAAAAADGVAPVLEDFVEDGLEGEEMERGEEEGRQATANAKEELKEGGEEAVTTTAMTTAAAAAAPTSSAPVEAFTTSLRNASLALAPSFMRPEWEAAGGGKERWNNVLLSIEGRAAGGGGGPFLAEALACSALALASNLDDAHGRGGGGGGSSSSQKQHQFTAFARSARQAAEARDARGFDELLAGLVRSASEAERRREQQQQAQQQQARPAELSPSKRRRTPSVRQQQQHAAQNHQQQQQPPRSPVTPAAGAAPPPQQLLALFSPPAVATEGGAATATAAAAAAPTPTVAQLTPPGTPRWSEARVDAACRRIAQELLLASGNNAVSTTTTATPPAGAPPSVPSSSLSSFTPTRVDLRVRVRPHIGDTGLLDNALKVCVGRSFPLAEMLPPAPTTTRGVGGDGGGGGQLSAPQKTMMICRFPDPVDGKMRYQLREVGKGGQRVCGGGGAGGAAAGGAAAAAPVARPAPPAALAPLPALLPPSPSRERSLLLEQHVAALRGDLDAATRALAAASERASALEAGRAAHQAEAEENGGGGGGGGGGGAG